MATKKASAKKAPARSAASKNAATANSARSSKTAATKSSRKSSTSKATVTKKSSPAKRTAATKAPAKKASTTKKATTATKTAPAKKAPATKKAPAKKAPAAATNAAPRKAAAPKKPAKSPFDKKFLDEQREALLEERANKTRQSDALLAEAVSLTENREPGDVQFDEESGEGDTLAVERERDLALSAQNLAQIEEIDAALQRIDGGTYGICRVSGLPIPKDRLRAIPWATERVEYKVGGFARR
jgi:RNA polymerase-binding transcription factor DksA